MSFKNGAAIRAHAELMVAIQKHEGKVVRNAFDPGLIETRAAGTVYADAEFFVQIIRLSAQFGTPAVVVAFIVYVRPILIKWIELKKGRSIEIRHGDTSVQITGENDIDKALETFKKLNSMNESKDD